MEDAIGAAAGLAALIVVLYLLTRWWAWVIMLAVGGLASVFAVFASIVHFQILGALGFTLLAALCWLGIGLAMMAAPNR